MQILDGKGLSKKIKEELIDKVEKMLVKPTLAVIQVGHDPASDIYIKGKRKLAQEIGINFEYIHYEEDIQEADLINKIKSLNADNSISGILIQLPLPEHLNKMNIINTITPKKDVDGLTDYSIGKLVNNQIGMVACTPKGIIRLLDEYQVPIAGSHAVIVGRSNLVGKPIANLLLNRNATVTICHLQTKDLSFYTKQADILVVATGDYHLIDETMVKDGVIIIDVGISRVADKLYGDVDFAKVASKASLITPVPGGVGPMTIISLMENVIETHLKNY